MLLGFLPPLLILLLMISILTNDKRNRNAAVYILITDHQDYTAAFLFLLSFVSMEIINNKIRRGGRKPSNIWIYFNDEEDSLNKISPPYPIFVVVEQYTPQ